MRFPTNGNGRTQWVRALLHYLAGKAARNPDLWLPVDRALSLAVSLTGMVPVLLGSWASELFVIIGYP